MFTIISKRKLEELDKELESVHNRLFQERHHHEMKMDKIKSKLKYIVDNHKKINKLKIIDMLKEME